MDQASSRQGPLRGLSTAFKTLTILPWPKAGSDDFAGSLPWFPVVGALLGACLLGIDGFFQLFPVLFWPAGMALLMVAFDTCATRGLHLDGLADWADSIGGFRDRESRLRIMKDTMLGAFGVLALVLAVLAKALAFHRMVSLDACVWIVPIWVCSRAMMVELITTLPYARPAGGMGKPFVLEASRGHRALCHLAGLLICALFGPPGLLLYGLGFLETNILRIRFRQQFGGITGDLLGATNELVSITLLLLVTFTSPTILPFVGWSWLF